VKRKLALFVSIVFQPLVIPSLVFALVLFAVPEASSVHHSAKQSIFYLVALSTLAIPMVTIIGLRLAGTLPSLHMADIKQRAIPFTITSFYYLITVYFLRQKTGLDPILWEVLALITVAIIGLTLITFFWKMSAHMTGLGGLLAAVVVLGVKFPNFQVLYPLLGSLLLTGIVATCRLYLDAHKPVEIYVGLIFGFLLCYLGFNLIWA